MDSLLKYNINPVVAHLNKLPAEFTKKDIIKFVLDKDIRIINFRYVAADGRLKTLNFPVSSYQYLESILTYGERVDGSSLFPFIEAGSSDLYVNSKIFDCIPGSVLGNPCDRYALFILHQRGRAAGEFT